MSPANSKTIWIINHFATSPDAPGGTRHYEFAVELAKRGYEVTIFAADLNYMPRKRIHRNNATERRHRTNGVGFTWVKSLRYKKNNWRRAANMLSFAFNVIAIGVVRKRPDLIVGSSPHLFAAMAAYILARIKGSRFYLEVRDLWPQTLIEMRGQGAKGKGRRAKSREPRTKNSRLYALSPMPYALCSKSYAPSSMLYAIAIVLLGKIEALLYRRADRIIVLSEGAGEYIAGRGIDPGKILLLPNGVYLEQFQITESRTNVRARLGLTDKFVVMYAGAHGQANALDTILDAGYLMQRAKSIERGAKSEEQEALNSMPYALCSQVAFVLVGDGPCKDELRQIVDEQGLNNVKMLSAVPKSSIPNMLNAADALVITLRSVDLFSYGVSPNKLFEYMASGKPILCAVNGEVANLVARANAGIAVEPENPEALAQAILSLARDRKRCSAYGANGRKFVEENFSRSHIVSKFAKRLESSPLY